MIIQCAYCGKDSDKPIGHYNRAKKIAAHMYCNKKCAGAAKRLYKSDNQKKEEKRLYDIEYKKKNLEKIKARKADAFKQNYDPVKAAIKRKENMPRHVEYCRRPEYKEWKKKYDEAYRAKKDFGGFYEAALLVSKIDVEVESRQSKYEIRLVNGTFNKTQFRRRDYEKLIGNKS